MNNSLSILLIYNNYISDRLYLLIKRKISKELIYYDNRKTKTINQFINYTKN